MPTFDESGLRLTLPEGAWFRFERMDGYNDLKPYAVSEMDFGWWHDPEQVFVLLEVKDYSVHEAQQDLRAKMIAKGRDCIVMLHAAWHGTSDIGRRLCAALPEPCRVPRRLQIRFVIKVGAGLPTELLTTYADHVQNAVRKYANLLGIRCGVAVLDHHKAIQKGLVSPIPPPPAG
jgi:hypothetical protein